MRKFTKEEDDFLRKNYLTIPTKRMSKILGRSEGTARQRMAILGIVVPRELIARFRKESQFPKGHIPGNKGKKQSEYLTPELIARTAKTRFKKGNIPPNTKSKDGVITVRRDHKDRNGKQYKWIRIGLGKWKQYSHYKWEKKYGKVPRGMCIVFKDGNSLNCNYANMELITRGENMRRNTIHNYPDEIKGLIRTHSKLKRKINAKKQVN